MPQVHQIHDDTVLSRNDGVVQAIVDGETVLMAPTDYAYFGIDAVGTRVWELLEQPRTLGALVAILMAEFDVAADTCRGDVVAFAGGMVDAGLITLDGP